MTSVLNQHVLVLNRLWQAVNVCTARRALTLLFQGHAQVVLDRDDGSFQTFNFNEWHHLSQHEPHPESIRTVSFRIRVPRVILLESFLSFLGLGTKPPEPEWGLMLNTLRTAIYVNPWVAALPGVMIFAVCRLMR